MRVAEIAGYLINTANVTHVLPATRRPDRGPDAFVLAIGLVGTSQLLEVIFQSEEESRQARDTLWACINNLSPTS